MSKWKNKPTRVKSEREQLIDAIIGADEEMTDELASEILGFYGIADNDLIESFKASISEMLKNLPIESEGAKRIAGMQRNLRDYQKEITGVNLSPKERIAQLFGGLFTPPVTASYSFRDRTEGELPDSDIAILDELKKELLDRSGSGEA